MQISDRITSQDPTDVQQQGWMVILTKFIYLYPGKDAEVDSPARARAWGDLAPSLTAAFFLYKEKLIIPISQHN